VPIDVGGRQSVKLIKNATLVVYEGAPHGFALTHKDRVNQDLLAFIQEGAPARQRELAGSGAGTR
jgi:non-heme chloroperoxidase